MTDQTPDVASTTEAQPAALKSTDTSSVKAVLAKAEAPVAPVPAKPEPKTPAEPVATAEPAGSDVEDDDAPPADSPAEQVKKKDRLPRWVKERMERVRLQTEADTRERVLRELQQDRATKPEATNVAQPAEREKTLEDFDFDLAAFQKHLARQAIDEVRREDEQRAQQQKQAAAVDEFKAKIDAFETRAGAGAWDDINESPVNTDPAFAPLVSLFLGDENDLEIAHHLATHLDEAQRLLALPPLQRVREVAKLADQFGGTSQADEPAQKAVPLPKKSTNAPPPPKTVSGAGKPAVDVLSPDMTTEQRIALWRKKG